MKDTKTVKCTSCGKRFYLGAPHQQPEHREDGMDACFRCVGCAFCGQWPCECQGAAPAERRTLAEFNANPRRRPSQDFWTVEQRFAVGSSGHRGMGTKVHFLTTEVIVEDRNPTPGLKTFNGKTFRIMKLGDTSSAHSACNGNGQFVGQVRSNLDTKDINCRKCLQLMGMGGGK